MTIKHLVALAGGVGGAKLALGLSRVLPPEQLTVIVNTGDDLYRYGLAISPDLDTVMYTLAGLANPQTGWGLVGDTTRLLEMLARYGEETWFGLGDQDFATHLLRTHWLAEGLSLTEATRRLCDRLGVQHHIIPMTDSIVRTMVDTVAYGWLEFQEYFVRYGWQPVVRALEYRGADSATISAQVRAAIEQADAVVICPSNPLLSIAPILAIPGMRELIGEKRCVAVTPIIAGQAVKGPAAKLMAELGSDVSAAAVAAYYGDLLAGFVLDCSDDVQFSGADFPCPVLITDTMMHNEQDKIRLAREILDAVEELFR